MQKKSDKNKIFTEFTGLFQRSIFLLSILIVILSTSTVQATYTYTITGGYGLPDLFDHESLLMTGGGHSLNLNDWSSARIENTAPLVSEGNGGIWQLSHAGSLLEILDGDVHLLGISNTTYGRTKISGGRIDELKNYQNVGTKWLEGTDPPVWVPDPHIEVICRDWHYNTGTKKLTGTWMDWSTFNIQLVDVAGYSPAIDNMFFTPEPISLLLFAAGSVMIRKR